MDLAHARIPNLLTFPVIITALALNYYLQGINGLVNSMAGFFIGAVVFLPFFIKKGIGGGDIKLFAAIGALKGYSFLLHSIVYSSLTAALITIFILIKRRKLVSSLRKVFRFFYSLLSPGMKVEYPGKKGSIAVPYGFAIAVGTLIVLVTIK